MDGLSPNFGPLSTWIGGRMTGPEPSLSEEACFPYSFREPLSKVKLESIDHWFTMKSFVKIIENNLKTFVGSKYKTTSGYI